MKLNPHAYKRMAARGLHKEPKKQKFGKIRFVKPKMMILGMDLGYFDDLLISIFKRDDDSVEIVLPKQPKRDDDQKI
jgi:hypothetical protein